jgi:hypothetical protein
MCSDVLLLLVVGMGTAGDGIRRLGDWVEGFALDLDMVPSVVAWVIEIVGMLDLLGRLGFGVGG